MSAAEASHRSDPQSPITLDVSGSFCPKPILELAKAMKGLEAGDRVELIGTDRGMLEDVPDWCRALGHQLLDIHQNGASVVALVQCQKRKK